MRPWYRKSEPEYHYMSPFARMTPAVRMLLIVTVVAFLLQWFLDAALNPILRNVLGSENKNALFKAVFGYSHVPDPFTTFFSASRSMLRRGFVWGPVTYVFLHSTTRIYHVLLNMMVLFFLGPETERGLGTRRFLLMYFMCGILGGLGWLMAHPTGSCIGASGAVFGVIGAFAMLYPRQQLTLLLFFIIPINMKAWVMACLLGGMELFMLFTEPFGGIAHGVHLAGGVAGIVFVWALRRSGQISSWSQYGFGPPPLPHKRSGAGIGTWWHRRKEKSIAAQSERIDQILDKIAARGIGSLTPRERSILQAQSRRGGRGR